MSNMDGNKHICPYESCLNEGSGAELALDSGIKLKNAAYSLTTTAQLFVF